MNRNLMIKQKNNSYIKLIVMKCCLFTAVIIAGFLSACNDASAPSGIKPAAVEKPGSNVKMVPAEQANLADPDPTDTIPAAAYGINTYSPAAVAIVKKLLATQYAAEIEKQIIDSFSRRFILFEYDLNDDGSKEILVGLNGGYFCGTGGCNLLLLNSSGVVITSFSVSGTPVIVANAKTNGWKDLYIYSNKKHRIAKFDGKKYPSNPSLLPALNTLPGDGLPRLLDSVNEPYPWFMF